MSDPGVTYRKREEVQDYRKTKDPILVIRNIGLKFNLVTEQELDVLKSLYRISKLKQATW